RSAHGYTCAATCCSSVRSSRARTRWPRSRPRMRSGCRSSSPGPRRTRRSPAACATAAPSCAGTSRKTSWPTSTAVPRRRACRRATGLRLAGARGDGVRDSGRCLGRRRVARGRRRRGGLRAQWRPRRCRPPRAREARRATYSRACAGAPVHVARDGGENGGRLPAAPRRVKVSAVVVSHGSAAELAELLPALRPQVDELVVIANVPGSAPPGIATLENERPLGFAANLNKGFALTTGEAVLSVNPDAVPHPGAVAALADFMAARPRCGVAGPRMVYPDGSLQPSR